jgi:predicted transposase YbfD/YdcC
MSAMEAALGVRQHRDIENGLHWVRDVVFQEDAAPFADFTPAINGSLLRSIALNLIKFTLLGLCKAYSSSSPFFLSTTNSPYP